MVNSSPTLEGREATPGGRGPTPGSEGLTLEGKLAAEATRLGFAACGIAPAHDDPLRAARLEQWLGEGCHGSMEWMETRLHHRRGPQSLWPDARSVIALGMSYAPAADPGAITAGMILRALEGSLSIVEESPVHSGPDPVKQCIRRNVWDVIDARIAHVLDSVTLADLAREYGRMRGDAQRENKTQIV